MKNVLIVIVCLCAVSAFAASDSADYNLTVHVSRSRMVRIPGNSAHEQYLIVTIDGKKYELQSLAFVNSVLELGDYKAKVVEDRHIGDASDDYRVYELLLDDQKARKFVVVGVSE